eukprot:INCI1058.4.p1 GENE.INCI1058.4~~INCI1058.4.p1  ORF type:complete len:361 (+),score=71.87 INCI1058.4:839-1921(+)
MVSLVWCSIVFRQGQKRFSCGWICFVIVLLFTEHRVVFVHAGENSPMKHSKPCAFRRCNATAETLALVLHFLQRVCKLVAIDEEQKPLLSEEETLRPDPPGFFTLKQIGTLQEWALTAQQFVDAQLGLVAMKRGQAPKADPAFEQAWPLERTGSEKRWSSSHKRIKAAVKKSVKLAGALKDDLLAAKAAASQQEALSPSSSVTGIAETLGACPVETQEPLVSIRAKSSGHGDDHSNDEEETKPHRAHAGNIAFGGHGEEWENTEPKARISNNKLLRAKREQAALQAKLASEPRRLMSGKAKKALLKARRQAQREAAGGEESNNPDPCKSSDGEITADGQPHSPAAWVHSCKRSTVDCDHT